MIMFIRAARAFSKTARMRALAASGFDRNRSDVYSNRDIHTPRASCLPVNTCLPQPVMTSAAENRTTTHNLWNDIGTSSSSRKWRCSSPHQLVPNSTVRGIACQCTPTLAEPQLHSEVLDHFHDLPDECHILLLDDPRFKFGIERYQM